MERDYKEQLSGMFPLGGNDLEEALGAVSFRRAPLGTVLLREGELATDMFIVLEGCLRAYYIKEDGKEITAEFFVENQTVASFESAVTGTPSRMYIDAIEDSVIGSIRLKDLEKIVAKSPAMERRFREILMRRLVYYMNRSSSHILDNPEKRYVRFLEENPDLVDRIPQQYLASYLGVTPVSLSRIRSRLRKKTGSN